MKYNEQMLDHFCIFISCFRLKQWSQSWSWFPIFQKEKEASPAIMTIKEPKEAPVSIANLLTRFCPLLLLLF